jgi:hypothetical protein
MAATAPASLHATALPALEAWFSRHGAAADVEIEARVRGGVAAAVFERVLRRLRAAPAGTWSAAAVEETLDVSHASETRATLDVRAGGGGAPPVFVRKEAVESHVDVVAAAGRARAPLELRFSCNAERRAPEPLRGDAPRNFRLKTRHKFARKGEFVFDLTAVRAGRTYEEAQAAALVFEAEVEWVGQARAAEVAGRAGARALAEKFLAKVQDLADLVADAQVE